VISAVDPLLAEAARIRFGQDLQKVDTEPALHEFVASTLAEDATVADRSDRIVFRTAVGEPSSAILETATAESADLIVMGTQGLGGFRKWLLGSTTERLLRRAHLPVLVVPLSTVSQRARSAGAVSHIVAAIDFSESSVAAAKMAALFARECSAQLTLSHVVEPLRVPLRWQSLAKETDETRVGNARAEMKRLADEVCGPQECERVVALGHAAEQIGRIAEDRHAEMIVMGLASEHGMLARRPGAIAYRVLSSTTLPVLVVPTSQIITNYV
jgi:nucleotide-binding universal stress UspA family protein